MSLFLERDPKRWVRLDEVDSTNAYVWRENLPGGSVVLARSQTRGRGRHGRDWCSRADDSFLFSGLLEGPLEPELLSLLPLVAGLAIRNAALKLQPAFAHEIYLKWPNDVILVRQGRAGKLAGALLETEQLAATRRIVIGIGLNWRGEAPVIPEQTRSVLEPISLFVDYDRPADFFALPLVEALNAMLARLYGRENSALLSEFRSVDFLRGKLVRSDSRTSRANGIADDGALLLIDGETGVESRIYDTRSDLELITGAQAWPEKSSV